MLISAEIFIGNHPKDIAHFRKPCYIYIYKTVELYILNWILQSSNKLRI